jgi:hypothetical protein
MNPIFSTFPTLSRISFPVCLATWVGTWSYTEFHPYRILSRWVINRMKHPALPCSVIVLGVSDTIHGLSLAVLSQRAKPRLTNPILFGQESCPSQSEMHRGIAEAVALNRSKPSSFYTTVDLCNLIIHCDHGNKHSCLSGYPDHSWIS